MYNLTGGSIVNLERITKLSLYECLTWLTYEVDLNETKKIKTDKQNKIKAKHQNKITNNLE